MTLNFNTIISMKRDLEYALQSKAAEQRNQIESAIKAQTDMIFTDLLAYFNKMADFRVESDVNAHLADRTSANNFINTQLANISIKLASVLNNYKAKEMDKYYTYLSKKEEIEAKIEALKSSVAEREGKLKDLEGKLTSLTSTLATKPADVSISELKSLQESLEKTQKETTESIKTQKEVSNDLKEVAVKVVNKEVEKVSEKTQEALVTEQTTNKDVIDNQTKQMTQTVLNDSKEVVQKVSDSTTDNKDQTTKAPDTPVPTTPITPGAGTTTTDIKTTTEDKAGTDQVQTASDNATTTIQKAEQTLKQDTTPVTTIVVGDDQPTPTPTPVMPEPSQSNMVPEVPVPSPTTTQTTEAVVIKDDAKNAEVKQVVTDAQATVSEVKAVTTTITEKVDKSTDKMEENLTQSQAKLEEAKAKVETTTTGPATAGTAPPIEQLQETASGLKEVHDQQKEALEAQKQAIALLEESKNKLIGDNTGQNTKTSQIGAEITSNATVVKELTADGATVQKEVDKDKATVLAEDKANTGVATDSKTKIITEAQQEAKALAELQAQISTAETERKGIISKILKSIEDLFNLKKSGTEEILERALDNIQNDETQPDHNLSVENQVMNKQLSANKTNSEVVFISKQLENVDQVLDNYQQIAQSASKIVVDKNLVDIYEILSGKLGTDKVVLDRRGTEDRRTTKAVDIFNTQNEESKPAPDSSKESERREKSDRRQGNLKFISELDDIQAILDSKDDNLA